MKSLRALFLAPALLLFAEGYCLEAFIDAFRPSFCGAPTGELSAWATGGTPPYSYSWSNGQTTAVIHGLSAGIYTLTVTDDALEQFVVDGEVESRTYDWFSENIGPPQVQGWCSGATPYAYPYGAFAWAQDEYYTGPGPWNFVVDGLTTPTVPNDCYQSWLDPEWYLPLDYPVGTTVQINYSDGNGCPGQAFVTIKPPIPTVPLQVLSVSGSCSNLSTGTVVIAAGPWQQPPVSITYYLGIALRTTDGVFLQPECGTTGVKDVLEAGSIQTFTGLAPGDYEVVVRPSDPTMPAQPEFSSCQSVPFTVPDMGVDCGVLTGRAFVDLNLNCTRQTNEPYAPNTIVEIQPGPYYAITSGLGQYSLTLPSGSYTLEQQSDILTEHCTGTAIPFAITADNTTTVDLPDTAIVPLDVRVVLSSGIARPGFFFDYAISAQNLTPVVSGATTVTFEFDPTLTYLSATPAPSTVSGNTLTWNQAQLSAWQARNYSIHFQVPPDVGLLGYELEGTATVSTANTDGNLANNTATNLRTITGAYDPNDKLAYTSSGGTEVWQINEDEWIDYTIRFQNTGTDTAFNVVITDTLPATLDPGSFQWGTSSHTCFRDLTGHGTLRFTFANIQLPDSNVNEAASHGFVSFRIKPRQPVFPGTTIENIANIYFDYNPPVITEPSVLTAEFSTGIATNGSDHCELYPNPAQDQITINASSVIRRVIITSMDGRIAMDLPTANHLLNINVSGLNSGPYVLTSQLVTGEWLRKPFIIARTQTRP